MLVLSRKPGERILIGDDVTLTVIEVRGARVRLGIDAPKHVRIHRMEVWQTIEEPEEAEHATR